MVRGLLMTLVVFCGLCVSWTAAAEGEGVMITKWRAVVEPGAAKNGSAKAESPTSAAADQVRWLQKKDGSLVIEGVGRTGTDEMVPADSVRLEPNQGYQITVRKYRMEGTKGWKTLAIALTNAKNRQYGFSLGTPNEGFVFGMVPEWRSMGGQFAFQPPVTLLLQRRAGQLEFLADDKLVFSVAEPDDAAFDRLSLRLGRQVTEDSVFAELAPVAIVPARQVTTAARSGGDSRLSDVPIPANRLTPLPSPESAAFPRIVLMHNMWWSGPNSPRFIVGGFSAEPQVPAGCYENAPLIPSATWDGQGNKLEEGKDTMAQLFRDARQAGIDVVIYDCFSDGEGEFASLFQMAEAARCGDSGVKVAPVTDGMKNDGLDFLKNFWLYKDPATGHLLRDHPNILRVGQSPVVLEYLGSRAIWAERAKRAEAVGGHFYVIAHANGGVESAVLGQLPPAVREQIAFAPAAYLFGSNALAFGNPDPFVELRKLGNSFNPPKIVGGSAVPGYIGVTRVGNLLDPRGTWLYRKDWVSKIKLNPDFVQMATGNDYSEATEQECSANSSFTFIDLARYFGTRWRTGQWPVLDKPQAFLSYRLAVSIHERAEFELVLLRPEITGSESASQMAQRFVATCRVRTQDGRTVELPSVKPEVDLGQVTWRFWLPEGFSTSGYGVPEVAIKADGKTVELPKGPAAPFAIMNYGEELARKWWSVPLHRIRAGVEAKVNVAGSPGNLYPRTVRVEGVPWDQVAGGVLGRNGITTLWYTLPGRVLRDGFVERFYSGPGYAPMRYEDGWKKRCIVDQEDRYTAVIRMRDDTLVYAQPALLPAPHVDPATVLDLMIPVPLDKLGPELDGWLTKQWKAGEDVLVDRGPLEHNVPLPPAGDPSRPAILRDSSSEPWYLRFDGKNNQIKAGVLTMPPGPLTVELVLRLRKTDHPQVIFDQWGNAMGVGLSSRGTLVVARQNQERKMDWLEGRRRLNPEQWYDVVAMYDGHDLRLYIDGVADGEPVASHGLRTDENTVIGGDVGMLVALTGMQEQVKGRFAGDISRIRVLQRVLSTEEVRKRQ